MRSRRVLMISPHFPPDSTAGTHRVRLLAPHLAAYGWEPTVLTVRPEDYEGEIDPHLADLVPASLRVVRCAAWPVAMTRRMGIGDLGLRSLSGLYRAASRLLRTERFDALFITIFPAYPALLGPLLARRFKVPFVLDYQDPWVNAWGVSVGGGPDGRVDWKSRASRHLAEWLEPIAVRSAGAITAVSPGTWAPIFERNPGIRAVTSAIPIGAEPSDFLSTRRLPGHGLFDPADGLMHLCSPATVAPLGMETMSALLHAVGLVRDRRPDLYARLRLHFIGTTAQTTPTDRLRVMPLARQCGVDDVVRETPMRVPYSASVRIQQDAGGLLALGSTEPHYTPSKIYSLLLARKPLLAIYHEDSTVVPMLQRSTRAPSVRLVTYGDRQRARDRVEAIAAQLIDLIEHPSWSDDDVVRSELEGYFAGTLAGRLADVLTRVTAEPAA